MREGGASNAATGARPKPLQSTPLRTEPSKNTKKKFIAIE